MKNSTLALSAITLVAVMLVMSTVAPAMALSAEDMDTDKKKKAKKKKSNTGCKKLSELIEENPENEGLKKAFEKVCRGGGGPPRR